MESYFIKLTVRPYALLACVLTVLAHGLLIAYLSTAKLGYSADGTPGNRVVQVALQEAEQVAVSPPYSPSSSSIKKKVATAEKELLVPVPLPSRQTADLRGQHYFESRELTQKPLVAIDIPDNFALLVTGVPDQVAVLRLLINEYGDVDLAAIEDTVLQDDVKVMLAATFKRVKFHPGELNGRAVKSQIRIAIRLGEEVVADTNDSGLR